MPPASVIAGSTYSFKPSAQSSAAVTFEITGMPAWANFDSNSGELSGTPAATDEGTTGHITISATNGVTTASLTPFTIRVNAPQAAPPCATESVEISWVAPTKNTDGMAFNSDGVDSGQSNIAAETI